MAYENLIRQAALANGLDPDVFLRQMTAESGTAHNTNAVSSAGAQGVGQLMPATARGLGVTDVNDPAQNINASAAYDKQLLSKFGGSYPGMLAAYNWGPGNLSKAGGNTAAAPAETQNYLARILPAGSQVPSAAGPMVAPQAQLPVPPIPPADPTTAGPTTAPPGDATAASPGMDNMTTAQQPAPAADPTQSAQQNLMAQQLQGQMAGRGTLASLFSNVAQAAGGPANTVMT